MKNVAGYIVIFTSWLCIEKIKSAVQEQYKFRYCLNRGGTLLQLLDHLADLKT